MSQRAKKRSDFTKGENFIVKIIKEFYENLIILE